MSKTAFFYDQPTLLDRTQHRQLKVKPLTDVRFAEKATSVPVLAAEWVECCLEYPIVFTKGQEDVWMSLAVTGLTDGQNLFVNAETGAWSGRYVPAALRRYPFVLVKDASDPDKLGVAVDVGSPSVAEEIEGGLPLFDEAGEPAPALQTALNLLDEFQKQVGVTEALLKRLDEAGLLVQTNMEVKSREGRLANLVGAWVIDEAKLREISPEQVTQMFQSGDLALVYAHLLSLRNMIHLLERQDKR